MTKLKVRVTNNVWERVVLGLIKVSLRQMNEEEKKAAILTGLLRKEHALVSVGIQHHGECTETIVGAICVETLSTNTHRLIQTLIDV